MSELKEDEFVCYISKELSSDEKNEDLVEISKKMQSFLGDSFEIDDVEEFNNSIYLTCICSSIKDYEHISLRTCYEISKNPLK